MSAVFALWLTLRLMLGALAAFLSTLRPFTPVEGLPTNSFTLLSNPWLWLERWVLAPWQRWDADWYVRILTQGFQLGDGSTQFHPLFIWLAQPFVWLGLPPLPALLLVSSLSGLGFLWVFRNLAAMNRTSDQARFSTLFLLSFPVSLVLFAPYTEALFLLLASLSLLTARKELWGWAGVFAGLSVLTRQQGLLLAFPLVYLAWQSGPLWPLEALRRNVRGWAGLLGLPLGILVVLLHRWRLNDLNLVFDSFHDLVYSLVISSSANRVVPVQSFLPPWRIAGVVMERLAVAPNPDLIINVVGGAAFVGLLVVAWRRMDMAERLYCLPILLVSLSYYTGPEHPLMGLLRHCYLAFPLFWATADALQRSWSRLLAVGLGIVGMAILTVGYVLEAWVM